MQSKYVLERVSHEVVELGKHPDPIERRNYNSSWQDKYWELIYKKGSYVSYLRELTEKQAARIMELEHDLRMFRRNHE